MTGIYKTDRLEKNFHLDVLENPNSGDDLMEYFQKQDAKAFEVSYYVEDQFMYMNMMNKKLGVSGIVEVCENLKTDTFLQHVNFSRNIDVAEAAKPKRMQLLHQALRGALKVNKTLTTLK